MLVFELSMPSNTAWNGRWAGAENYYAIVRNLGRGKKAEVKERELLKSPYYRHAFGDGWVAAIKVRKISAREAAKIRKRSKGFCGYSWMVDDIINYGKTMHRFTQYPICPSCNKEYQVKVTVGIRSCTVCTCGGSRSIVDEKGNVTEKIAEEDNNGR